MFILIIFIYLILPAGLVYLTTKSTLLNKIGVVLLCYVLGIIAGNSPIVCSTFTDSVTTLSEVSVVLALPLLLFSINIKKWFSLAGKAAASMIIASAVIVTVSTLLFLIFRSRSNDAWQMSGMAVGLYTGGTPNLASIKSALNIDNNLYIKFHTYDTLFSFFYLVLILSVGQKLFNKFMIPFSKSRKVEEINSDNEETIELNYRGLLAKGNLIPVIIAFLLSGLIVGASVFGASFFPAEASAPATILLITTLAIVASLFKKIRSIKMSFSVGMYLIYVFCLSVASLTDIKVLVNIDFTVLIFIGSSLVATFILHAIFCRLFKIDTDTFLITSVSAICSPPFVPVVASALKNKTIIISGITTGMIGYGIGNYLGITLALLLKN